MTSMKSRSEPSAVIINGFDRSGTSAIVRTLAQHPDIEIFMQPFNSGPIRRRMNEIWDERVADAADIRFFRGLEARRIERDYIVSHWFERDSTTTEFLPGRLHVIKTTINHLAVRWIRDSFPALDQWAIWREPHDILASLIRNGFDEAWYSQAFDELLPTVRADSWLEARFGRLIDGAVHPHARMAFVIAVRNAFLMRHTEPDRILRFEDFLHLGPGCLKVFSAHYGLRPFDFSVAGDLNIVGKAYEPGASHVAAIDPAARDAIEAIFAPLKAVMAAPPAPRMAGEGGQGGQVAAGRDLWRRLR